jgi:hypothetical protein
MIGSFVMIAANLWKKVSITFNAKNAKIICFVEIAIS